MNLRVVRSSEKKRRQLYRGEVQGQLPFETKAMGEVVPAIDFSPTGGGDLDNGYSLERDDVESMAPDLSVLFLILMQILNIDMMRVMDDLEEYARSLDDEDVALNIIGETKASLQKLVEKMDGLETNFDRIAERSRTFLSDLFKWCRSDHPFSTSYIVFAASIIKAALWV